MSFIAIATGRVPCKPAGGVILMYAAVAAASGSDMRLYAGKYRA